MKEQVQPLRKRFYVALTGTIAVAICCFTPVLVVALAAVGLSAFTPYLDYVLFPALGILVILTLVSYRKWKKTQPV
jgi:mercuric ion transport protein